MILLMVGLFSPVFIPHMAPFNFLLLVLAAVQPVLMKDYGHQIDKHVIDGRQLPDDNSGHSCLFLPD
ncbi:hypothetical protein BG55_07365 [Erwinia mallotivora]|uniref:Uncharacterized protein n=1 Tax=Erwinia mallotivora TaxID=69222 RepID=A0A014NQD1_9GAMM|nr:hypothetical protein BG55_07365 [Erwinia mallotivora]